MTETMTTDEAMKTLIFLHSMCNSEYCLENGKGKCEDCAEAVDMAIKALEEKQKREEESMKDKICGTCKWHEHENIDDGWVCVNDRSEYCADWTEYTDTCDEWEERE